MHGNLERSAWALVVAQVAHGFIPADTDAEGYAGLVAGLVLLLASLAAVFGIRAGRSWAPELTMWTGATVAVGFVVYHVVPVRSPFTNPYLGEPVGAAAWIGVAVAVVAGAWAATEGRRAQGGATPRRAPAGA